MIDHNREQSKEQSEEQSAKTKVLVIGGGPAGYTASIYAARSNLKPIQVLGMEGGQLMVTTDVENYPGFSKTIQGPFLMEEMRKQAENMGTIIYNDFVDSLKFDSNNKIFKAKTQKNIEIISDVVIFATGADAKWLGIESEKKFQGFGVSACATCDGFFFRDKKVAVIGGGDTAVEEAIFLTNHASQVLLIHRRNELRAENILQDRLFKNKKIKVLWDSIVDEILGETDQIKGSKKVTGIRIQNIKTQTKEDISLDGVFIAIGHTPNSQLLKGKIELDPQGYVITEKGSTKTSIPGLFVAGDVQDKIFRQAVTAAGQGCMAAIEAEHFLSAR
jgi:thioredoxin reductase (NADPH)